jgi:anti-sigma factor RsiW
METWALHAYADGELDAAGRAEIERLLADDPSARAELAAWQKHKDALHRAYDGILDEPVPPPILRTLRSGGPKRRPAWPALAASLALLLIGGASGWLAGGALNRSDAAGFADSALAAHGIYTAEVRHPVEVAASEKDHLQNWLSKRVGVAFRIPDLTPQGYTLLGGRLLAMEGRPAAQIMYEDHTGRRITLNLAMHPAQSEQSIRLQQNGDLIACYWQDGQLGVVVAGDLAEKDMMALARVVYDHLERQG